MRNFLAGLLLGVLVTYCYLQKNDMRLMVEQIWARCLAPPPAPASFKQALIALYNPGCSPYGKPPWRSRSSSSPTI